MRLENKATLVSTSVATVLVVMKLTIAIISGSVAVLASAIDSLLDVSVSIFNFFVLQNSQKKPDSKFNHGRGKFEALAAVIEGTVIGMSALFVLYQAIVKIIHFKHTTHLDESMIIMIISTIATGLLVMFLVAVANKTHNMVIRADATHYKTDFISNIGVFIALYIMHLTHISLVDPIVGIIIAAYMIYSAIPVIDEGVKMLLDASLEADELQKIKNLLDNSHEFNTYHFLRTRKAGQDIFISAHLVFDMDTTLFDAHSVSDKIEIKLHNLFPNNNVHTTIHLDPYDDSELYDA